MDDDGDDNGNSNCYHHGILTKYYDHIRHIRILYPDAAMLFCAFTE